VTKARNEAIDRLTALGKKIDKFADLLDNISAIEDKKKLLWKEIYENALNDRENANALYTDLYLKMQGSQSDHMQVGAIMAKYLERMCKSNEQILKLAELISREESKSAKIDPDDMFAEISGGG
jgi:hypothetical protein|tara:strand:+ start:4834 stop:5205 length:372 start_codon:yes stop_codon:yes gene_type:complete